MTKKYSILFLVLSIFVIGIDLLFSKFLLPHIPLRPILGLDLAIYFIFIVGTIIIAPGLEIEPKNFVGRFLVLTTAQMLSALAIFAAIVFVKFPNFQTVVLHTLVVFVLLMVIQSILLLRFVNSK